MSATTVCPIRVKTRLANCLRSLQRSAKQIGRDTGRSPRTIEKYWDGTSEMPASVLISMMAKYDDVYKTVCEMAERQPMSAEAFLNETLRRLRDSNHE